MNELIVENLLEILYDENPNDNLIVFDLDSNGYCIEDIQFKNNKLLLVSTQECVNKINNELLIQDFINMIHNYPLDTIVEVVIALNNEHKDFISSQNNSDYHLFLHI